MHGEHMNKEYISQNRNDFWEPAAEAPVAA
jgi:hypothetical protein